MAQDEQLPEEKTYTLQDIKDSFFPNRDFDIMQVRVEQDEDLFVKDLFRDLLKKQNQT